MKYELTAGSAELVPFSETGVPAPFDEILILYMLPKNNA